jgi:N-formylglutamate deformylase
MPTDLFTLRLPQAIALPIVANLPHSGLQIPDEMAAQFTPEHLRSLPNSDWHLQALYSFLPSLGIPVLQANYSRYVVDLNRALRPPFLGSFWSSVVPEATAFKQPIYSRLPSEAEVAARIDEFYTPYHQQLADLLNEAIAQFGQVYLLDLHSFMGLITDDVCLGNADGQTCSSEFIDHVASSFAQQGYRVVKNKVFTGGFITRHYGQQPQVNALQIELHYPTYLPEDQLETGVIPQWQGPKFEQAQARLESLFQAVAEFRSEF